MRFSSPIRALAGTVLLWGGLRIALLRPDVTLADIVAPIRHWVERLLAPPPSPPPAGAPPVVVWRAPPPPLAAPMATDAARQRLARAIFYRPVARERAAGEMLMLASFIAPASHDRPHPRGPEGEPIAAPAAPPPAPAAGSRWSGSAYLFARQGSGGAALGPGGQLGGSQAGARIAWAVDAGGRLALAARASVPLHDRRGAELAAGIDVRPFPLVPLRFSIERRVALGRHARDAFSAYAAGGFFTGLGDGFELDGYAQAGVVGSSRADLFGDGALRIGRRWPLGARESIVAGAGAWAAAQPGAARLDLGPRVALSGRLAGQDVSLALEGRLRVAGRARPGSGVALTLASDF